MMNISDLRKEYRLKELSRKYLEADPLSQFKFWFEEAIKAQVLEPTAMALATSDNEGHPSCRMVLLKYYNENGFIFFTNMESPKATDLLHNPYASALFWWKEIERQVIIKGKVERVSDEQSAAYFAKRPRKSQLGSFASRQSSVIASRKVIEEEYARLEKQYEGQEIPLPPFWGGFRIIPQQLEFWQGRDSRMHDRFRYTREGEDWKIDRLSP